jgi:hypothetical protein
MRFGSFVFFTALALVGHAYSEQVRFPPVDQVVAKMIEHDERRQAALRGYTAVRKYVLENQRHHKRAEMVVQMRCLENGSKEFETISASGWGGARNHVFPRLLDGEREASLPDARQRSRITPDNYSFEMVATDYVNDRRAYVLSISPKTENKYVVRGRIWVDTEDYAIIRIEGAPAKPPSFWIKSVEFVHTYQKSGSFWFPATDRSVTDVRLFGTTELTIQYFDYAPQYSALSNSSLPASSRSSTAQLR